MNTESSYILLWKDEDPDYIHALSGPLTEEEKEQAIVLIELLTNDGKREYQKVDFVDFELEDIMDKYDADDYIFVKLSPEEVERYKKEKIYVLFDGRQ